VLTAIESGKSFTCEERPPTISEVGIVKVSAVTWGTFDEEASKTCLSRDQLKSSLLISAGDFLFSRANTIQLVGACVIVHQISKRLMLSDKILRFKFHSVYPPWVLHALRSIWGRAEIERLATGNQESMRNIGQDRIRAIRIPFPPVDEQHRIVAEIEKQFTRIEAAASGLFKVETKLRRFCAKVLEKAATGQPDWKTLRLRDLGGEIRNGISAKPTQTEGLPILRISSVRSMRVNSDLVRFLPSRLLKNGTGRKLPSFRSFLSEAV